jgi:hypothetical protein
MMEKRISAVLWIWIAVTSLGNVLVEGTCSYGKFYQRRMCINPRCTVGCWSYFTTSGFIFDDLGLTILTCQSFPALRFLTYSSNFECNPLSISIPIVTVAAEELSLILDQSCLAIGQPHSMSFVTFTTVSHHVICVVKELL